MVYTSQKLKVGRPLPQPSNAMWEKKRKNKFRRPAG